MDGWMDACPRENNNTEPLLLTSNKAIEPRGILDVAIQASFSSSFTLKEFVSLIIRL